MTRRDLEVGPDGEFPSAKRHRDGQLTRRWSGQRGLGQRRLAQRHGLIITRITAETRTSSSDNAMAES